MKEKLLKVLNFFISRLMSFLTYQCASLCSLLSPEKTNNAFNSCANSFTTSTTTSKPKDDDPVHVLSVENGKVSHRTYRPDRARKHVEKNRVPVSKSNSFH
jgi:hypothetical protein